MWNTACSASCFIQRRRFKLDVLQGGGEEQWVRECYNGLPRSVLQNWSIHLTSFQAPQLGARTAGSGGKGCAHIFWGQRLVEEGDREENSSSRVRGCWKEWGRSLVLGGPAPRCGGGSRVSLSPISSSLSAVITNALFCIFVRLFMFWRFHSFIDGH